MDEEELRVRNYHFFGSLRTSKDIFGALSSVNGMAAILACLQNIPLSYLICFVIYTHPIILLHNDRLDEIVSSKVSCPFMKY